MNIEDFKAYDARKNAEERKKGLYDVLYAIKEESENGGRALYIDYPVEDEIIYDLKYRGFDVKHYYDENYFYKIMW